MRGENRVLGASHSNDEKKTTYLDYAGKIPDTTFEQLYLMSVDINASSLSSREKEAAKQAINLLPSTFSGKELDTMTGTLYRSIQAYGAEQVFSVKSSLNLKNSMIEDPSIAERFQADARRIGALNSGWHATPYSQYPTQGAGIYATASAGLSATGSIGFTQDSDGVDGGLGFSGGGKAVPSAGAGIYFLGTNAPSKVYNDTKIRIISIGASAGLPGAPSFGYNHLIVLGCDGKMYNGTMMLVEKSLFPPGSMLNELPPVNFGVEIS